MDFIAIDVETANSDRSTICQIGVVAFKDGTICHEWNTLIDPRCGFDGRNIAVHGITARDVCGAPTWAELHPEIDSLLRRAVLVAHSSFDKGAITSAYARHGTAAGHLGWLDTVMVARRAWPGLERYTLDSLAARFGIRFEHHDALEDARTCGLVMQRAMADCGLDIPGWLQRVSRPVKG